MSWSDLRDNLDTRNDWLEDRDAELNAWEEEAEAAETDLNAAKVTVQVRCSSCGKISDYPTVAEDLGGATPDTDGVYPHPCGECIECVLEPERTSVSQARAMGFDEDTIADLLAEGLLKADEVWRPRTLDDVNFLVMRERQYDAEEARITEQHERRLHKIRKRREWIRRYDDDCLEVMKRELPRRKDGTYREKYLDLPDGRVLLREEGGGLSVESELFLRHAQQLVRERREAEPEVASLLGALRATRTETRQGVPALEALLYHSDWKRDVLKTPISEYLKAHPDATLPGVTVEPKREVFRIERPKARKGEGDGVL